MSPIANGILLAGPLHTPHSSSEPHQRSLPKGHSQKQVAPTLLGGNYVSLAGRAKPIARAAERVIGVHWMTIIPVYLLWTDLMLSAISTGANDDCGSWLSACADLGWAYAIFFPSCSPRRPFGACLLLLSPTHHAYRTFYAPRLVIDS